MSTHAVKCVLMSLTTVVASLFITSCSQMGSIVSTSMISKLSGSDDNNSEISVLNSGAIIYRDKKRTEKSSKNYNEPDFGPQSIKFGPE